MLLNQPISSIYLVKICHFHRVVHFAYAKSRKNPAHLYQLSSSCYVSLNIRNFHDARSRAPSSKIFVQRMLFHKQARKRAKYRQPEYRQEDSSQCIHVCLLRAVDPVAWQILYFCQTISEPSYNAPGIFLLPKLFPKPLDQNILKDQRANCDANGTPCASKGVRRGRDHSVMFLVHRSDECSNRDCEHSSVGEACEEEVDKGAPLRRLESESSGKAKR